MHAHSRVQQVRRSKGSCHSSPLPDQQSGWFPGRKIRQIWITTLSFLQATILSLENIVVVYPSKARGTRFKFSFSWFLIYLLERKTNRQTMRIIRETILNSKLAILGLDGWTCFWFSRIRSPRGIHETITKFAWSLAASLLALDQNRARKTVRLQLYAAERSDGRSLNSDATFRSCVESHEGTRARWARDLNTCSARLYIVPLLCSYQFVSKPPQSYPDALWLSKTDKS